MNPKLERRFSSMLRDAHELSAARHVLWQLTRQQLILRYRRTLLGYVWTLVNPLLMMSVMALVFSSLFKSDLESFAIFLFAGMVPWNLINAVVIQSSGAYIQNEGLIKKIYIPKIVFPLSIAIASFIDSVLAFVALLLLILIIGGKFSLAMVFVLVGYGLLFAFCLGIGLTMSIATVFFRDLQYVMVIAMQGLFFLTPILYKVESLTDRVGWLVSINPIVPFIEIFRAPLYEGRFPSAGVVSVAAVLSFLSLALGVGVHMWQRKNIVYRL